MKEKNVNGSACYSEHVFVRIEWGYKRVCIHDILYLEAQQDCCNIYLLKENHELLINRIRFHELTQVIKVWSMFTSCSPIKEKAPTKSL